MAVVDNHVVYDWFPASAARVNAAHREGTMDRRTPMVAGIAFAVLYTVALILIPRLPGIDQPGFDIVAHVNEHSATMRVQALLLAFGSLALAVLLGYARERLTGPPSYVFTIGAAAVLVQVFITTWFTAGLALHPDQLGSATARTITDIVSMWSPMLTITNILMAVPILLAANAGRFPRWLGIIAAVFAVEQLIETITIIGPPGSFISPSGPMNSYLGAPLFILFFLALGIALSLEQQRDNRSEIVDEPDAPDKRDAVDNQATVEDAVE
jgi:hypothetical protein